MTLEAFSLWFTVHFRAVVGSEPGQGVVAVTVRVKRVEDTAYRMIKLVQARVEVELRIRKVEEWAAARRLGAGGAVLAVVCECVCVCVPPPLPHRSA